MTAPDWMATCPRCGKTVLNDGDLCSRCENAIVKTEWADIEAAARTEPILYQLVMLVDGGYLTREEGLIVLVFNLIDIQYRQNAQILDLLNTSLPRIIVVKENGQ